MQGGLLVIHPDGRLERTLLRAVPDLEQLQAAVGGPIELIPFFTRFDGEACVAFCHEEGKLRGLPFNPVATEAWYRVAGLRTLGLDVLVGPVAVVSGDRELMTAL